MTKMVTIHPGLWQREVRKYGFESSQLSRKKIADYLGWGHLYILTHPQVRPDWKAGYEQIGFERDELVSVSHYQSDIGHDELSIRPSDIIDRYPNGKMTVINGFVASIELEEETLYFTSGLYLKKNKKEELEWLNRDGSTAMRARYYKPREEPSPIYMMEDNYLYYKDGEWLTYEDLLIQVLISLTDKKDILIRDQHNVVTPKLWRFVENTNRLYWEYIHDNVLLNPAHNLRRKTRYLVASEVLTSILQDLGYHAQFMPPIFAPQVSSVVLQRRKPSSYCYVGNMSKVKRVEWIIEAFRKLEQEGLPVEVFLYGGDIDKLKKEYPTLPSTIHVVGYVDEVPYWEHDGYISTSQKELFSNACVEAMSFGLIPLLSNVEIAHQYYASKNSDICLYDTPEELAHLIKCLYETDKEIELENTSKFVNRYSKEQVSKRYLSLMNA